MTISTPFMIRISSAGSQTPLNRLPIQAARRSQLAIFHPP
jgi:hypothetical protein